LFFETVTKPDFSSKYSRRKAQPQHWYDMSIGSSEYHLCLSANTQQKRLGVDLYIQDNKELYEKFLAQKDAIEQFMNVELEWRERENAKACRILTLTDGDIKKGSSTWNPLFDWFIEMALKFKAMVKQFDV
jgi:hypothetical protein